MVTGDTETSLTRPRGGELSQVAVTTRYPSPHEGENSTVELATWGRHYVADAAEQPADSPNLEHPSGAVR